MRIVKKFVTAHAGLDGEIRMRIVKKFRDCACGLRSRRESDHRGEGGRPKGRNRNAHRASIVAAVGMGEQAWEKGVVVVVVVVVGLCCFSLPSPAPSIEPERATR